MAHEEEQMYCKYDEVEIESQDHGKMKKANMSTSRANRVSVIEYQIWFCLPGSHHYDNIVMSTSHSNRAWLI